MRSIVPPGAYEGVVRTFSFPGINAFRINPLKGPVQESDEILRQEGFLIEGVPWFAFARIVKAGDGQKLGRHPLTAAGRIYQQELSSMIPAVVLDARPGERILDACAAPGSKMTQMAAMMGDQGAITAIEAVRSRFFRLRSVGELLGVSNVAYKLCDARRFRVFQGEMFDRVLVDAPCSSEGRFREDVPESTAYWSARKIREMSYKQKGILMSVSRLLRPGGILVYATCSFAPEENEEVVDWFLRKTSGEFVLEDIALSGVPRLPSLSSWGRDDFDGQVSKCWRVMPDGEYTGFFVARLRRKKCP